MSDPATTPAPEAPFADYLRTENAREQADARGDLPAEPAPAETTAEAVGAEASGETRPQEPAEPTEPEAERNADGTFKPKDKLTAKGEWKRNQQLTAQLRETERQLAEARQARQVTDDFPRGTPIDPSDPEPKLDDFLDSEKYPDALHAHTREMARWAVRQDRRESAAMQARDAVTARVEAFAAEHPDYQEKIASVSDVQFPPDVLEALADDDLGPAVAYHLASHPDEARRIAALRPLEGVKAIGKLLTRFETAPSGSVSQAAPVSKAKPLIKPVSAAPIASAASPPDPEKTPLSDWIRIGNAEDRRRAEANRGAF